MSRGPGDAPDALRRVRAVVFDLDGVLVDSWAFMRQVFEAACTACANSADVQAFRELLGRPLPEIASALGLGEAFVGAYERLASERVGELRLYAGARGVLDALASSGYRLALNTGKGRRRTLELLGRLGLDEHFECVVSADDVRCGKPHPESLLLVAARLGLTPERMAFVGDMPADVECARAAGVVAVGAIWGVGTADELRRARPLVTLEALSSLSRVLPGPARD